MKILALETSTELCSTALYLDGAIHTSEAHAGQRHSELLLPMVDALLSRHGVSVRALDGIAYGAGPGSFTGLRIACGVVQGIAFGADLPVVGVSTLLALAAAAEAERAVCCIDARMGEIYHAAFQKLDGDWQTVHEAGLYKPEAAPALPGNGWTACGNGFAAYRGVLEQRYAHQLDNKLESLAPHAREIALLSIPRFERGESQTAEHAVPVYVRNKVALRINERGPATKRVTQRKNVAVGET